MQKQINTLQQALIAAIEGAGFHVSGPTDIRAAEHGEPIWVCNARAALADTAIVPVVDPSGIKDKWKRFAIDQVRSESEGMIDSVELYNLIEQTEDDMLEALFEEHKVIVWQQFDNLSIQDVACQITELATRAQDIDNQADSE